MNNRAPHAQTSQIPPQTIQFVIPIARSVVHVIFVERITSSTEIGHMSAMDALTAKFAECITRENT